jgi:hypothetical protein
VCLTVPLKVLFNIAPGRTLNSLRDKKLVLTTGSKAYCISSLRLSLLSTFQFFKVLRKSTILSLLCSRTFHPITVRYSVVRPLFELFKQRNYYTDPTFLILLFSTYFTLLHSTVFFYFHISIHIYFDFDFGFYQY